MLDPAGPVGIDDRTVLLNALVIMLAIVVPVIIMTLAFAWWFRNGNTRAKHLPDWEFSGRLELLTWSIPILVVIFLGGIGWLGSHKLDPMKPLPGKAIEVDVVALDWKWLFIYPEQGVATVNALTVPAGVPIRFRITSGSVMNAFFIPRLGSMIYAMNGMATELHLQANAPGRYEGMSSHFSGDGFPSMRFMVDAVPADRFAAWTAQARAAGPVLDAAAYARLAEQSSAVKPYGYRAIDRRLFDAIVTQKIAPAPGPRDPLSPVSPGRMH